MTPEQVQEIINYLIKTGEFLGTQAFKLAYKQALYLGITNIIAGILLLISIVIVAKWCSILMKADYYKSKYNKASYDERDDVLKEIESLPFLLQTIVRNWDEDYFGIHYAFGVFFSVLALFFAIGALLSGLGYLFNPEWKAIELLLTTVTK